MVRAPADLVADSESQVLSVDISEAGSRLCTNTMWTLVRGRGPW